MTTVKENQNFNAEISTYVWQHILELIQSSVT